MHPSANTTHNRTSARRTRSRTPSTRRAFTIIELSIVLIIIALLAGILVTGISKAVRSSREAAEQQLLRSLSFACGQFKDQFNILPPLVRDTAPGPIDSGDDDPIVRSPAFLEDPTNAGGGERFSVHSLPYFLLGACGKDVDGIEGFGYTKPLPLEQHGADFHAPFSKRGQKFEPLIDLTKGKSRVVREGTANDAQFNNVRINDRWNNSIRYYRWQKTYFASGPQKGEVEFFRIPPGAFPPAVWKEIIKDPSQYLPMTSAANRQKAETLAATLVPQLRNGEFAIVSAGPDGQIADAPADVAEASRNLDNLVEVGQ